MPAKSGIYFMEQYIQITKLNDFVFCPLSLYFHGLYEKFDQDLYHEEAQKAGKIKHENIDRGQYSSRKRYLQGLPVYSERFGLCGKIDVYDREEKALIERKNKVTKFYDGYRYQLYAQSECMGEMGYPVEKLFVHSLSDNKRYEIMLPDVLEMEKFMKIIKQINNLNLYNFEKGANPKKCDKCIYRELCNQKYDVAAGL